MYQTNRFVFPIIFIFCITITVCYCKPAFTTSDERIRSAGYQSEVHRVKTEDGYILTLFRIVTSSNRTDPARKYHPILLLHGMMMSSDCFLLGNTGLGFVLARDNWDVWLGNVRGNSYSRLHTWLSPNESDFWDYSFHDMGRKDVPVMVDYILNHTARPRLNYIGHSMGTTIFYVMTSTMPSYNKKINAMVSLSAVGKMTGWQFLLNNESQIYQYVYQQMMKKLRNKQTEIFPRQGMEGLSKNQVLPEDFHMYFRIGFEFCKWIMEEWASGEKLFPDSSSAKNFIHFLQIISTGKFQGFDYGSRQKNLKIWGTESPPSYNMSKIKTPMVVYMASGDLVVEQDVENLARSFPNLIMLRRIASLAFGHIDFCYATSSLNLELRRKLHLSIIEVLTQRDKNLSPTNRLMKNVCDHDKHCIKVL